MVQTGYRWNLAETNFAAFPGFNITCHNTLLVLKHDVGRCGLPCLYSCDSTVPGTAEQGVWEMTGKAKFGWEGQNIFRSSGNYLWIFYLAHCLLGYFSQSQQLFRILPVFQHPYCVLV